VSTPPVPTAANSPPAGTPPPLQWGQRTRQPPSLFKRLCLWPHSKRRAGKSNWGPYGKADSEKWELRTPRKYQVWRGRSRR